MKQISVIVPCYNEQESIPLLYRDLCQVMQQCDYGFELIFVDDGSNDETLNTIKTIAAQDTRVHYLSFSRNFGKEAAMYAGLKAAKGDYVCIMDADGQDPPRLLPQMINLLESGQYDSVATRRVSRKGEPKIRSFFARLFYKLIGKITDADIADGARDYRLMRRCVVEAVLAMSEKNRFSKGIFGWVGFRTYWLSFENEKRSAGETKWSFFKLVKYSLDGIVNFSHLPLSIASMGGLILTAIAAVMLVFIVVRRLVFGDPVAGWASTVCIVIFIGGVQLFCMGIMGQYIAKMYTEVKNRPHYIVSQTDKEDIDKIG
ncbi:MAG: glycosyltransferase family 2 protein [Oscillospiraceae bacterium]|nr:glycosyltransferase family 2 protein [Oscillospiraceae bacterium]